MAIVNQFMIGNTKILIDDIYFPKTEKERQLRYEEFNQIGCEILRKEKINDSYLRKAIH